ncbi:MAG: hypothetical protein NC041_03355 [Bacteroides sp.]|nr:hypothetical protein [Prevotella sp.]MCM1408161.1 hypothetical protein [Treponema brennaborense]MCM1469485.1 hypothetical protein [Bacteroides sp.]
MRKSFRWFAFVFAAAFFASCSGEEDTFPMPLYTDTARYQSLARMESVEWTEDLEQNALTAPSAVCPLAALPENLCAAGGNNISAVYPAIDGFGSLDVSFLTEEQYAFVAAFCASVSSGTLDESVFSASAADTLPVLRYELSSLPPVVSFAVGKPYLLAEDDACSGNPVLEIPVRFYFENGISDSRIFFSADDEKSGEDAARRFCVEQMQFGEITDG